MRNMFVLYVSMILLTACNISPSEKEMDRLQTIDRYLMVFENNTEEEAYERLLEGYDREFKYIVSNEELALRHLLDSFENSKNDGFKEYMMARACIEILGDENPINEWSTGREWFEKYIVNQDNRK